MTYKEKVYLRIYEKIASGELRGKHLAVLNEIIKATDEGWQIMQADIVERVQVGSHPLYEQNNNSSTQRYARDIVRQLRIKYQVPIISNKKGYKIVETEEEAKHLVDSLERKARSVARAHFQTYQALKPVLEYESEYMEQLTMI